MTGMQSDCVVTTISCEKGLVSLTNRKYVHCGIKLNLKTLALERTVRGAFQLQL